jgi:hypothetical protein
VAAKEVCLAASQHVLEGPIFDTPDAAVLHQFNRQSATIINSIMKMMSMEMIGTFNTVKGLIISSGDISEIERTNKARS